jgi:hypothetical protein
MIIKLHHLHRHKNDWKEIMKARWILSIAVITYGLSIFPPHAALGQSSEGTAKKEFKDDHLYWPVVTVNTLIPGIGWFFTDRPVAGIVQMGITGLLVYGSIQLFPGANENNRGARIATATSLLVLGTAMNVISDLGLFQQMKLSNEEQKTQPSMGVSLFPTPNAQFPIGVALLAIF